MTAPQSHHLYVPLLRPASRWTLPDGVQWEYVEAPAMHGLADRPDLPQSPYRYGAILLSRELTAEELAHFDLRPYRLWSKKTVTGLPVALERMATSWPETPVAR